MSDKKTSNPWADRELNRNEEPMVEEGETLHEGDEHLDEEVAEELEDLAATDEQLGVDNAVHHKLAQAQEQLIRMQAEMENVRRRSEQDVAKAHKYAIEKFVKELLPVVDSLEQALQNKGDETGSVVEGVELTLKMFVDTLARLKVEQINPEGERFDPQEHEAMSMQPGTGAEPNTVIMVVQKGYKLNGRLIRPARVIVSK